MQAVDREGIFRAEISGYGLKEFPSGAISIALKARLVECWDGGEWIPWAEYEQEAYGDVWIITKEGNVNQIGAESLMKCAGWDGLFDSIANETWTPPVVQVTVKKEEYQGNVRFKIAYVNDAHRTPGAMGNMTPEKAKALQSRFGSQLRALAGNVQRNGAAPANRPAPPPVPTGAGIQDANGNDIPF